MREPASTSSAPTGGGGAGSGPEGGESPSALGRVDILHLDGRAER